MLIPKTKTEINAILVENYVEVVFTKVDGTSRKMIATLLPEIVEQVANKNGRSTGSTRTVPEHQVCCIDAEKGEWRSFKIDSVISFNVVEVK